VLANTVGSFQTWLGGQTGGRTLRLDTYQGALDITFLRIGRSNATMVGYGAFVRDTIEKDLATAGFAAAGKIYAVYYDGGSTFACGGGSLDFRRGFSTSPTVPSSRRSKALRRSCRSGLGAIRLATTPP
jgi:hypothetical protein